jgi:hypothetical protein
MLKDFDLCVIDYALCLRFNVNFKIGPIVTQTVTTLPKHSLSSKRISLYA